MKKIVIIISLLILSNIFVKAQTTIVTDDSLYTPTSTNALFEVHSNNNDKGVLVPRLTTVQRIAIVTSATNDISLLVYDTDFKTFWYFDGTNWVEMATGGTVTDNQSLHFSNDTLYIERGDSVYLGDYMELPSTAVNGQVLTWNGTNWVAQNASSGADNWGSQVIVSDATLNGDGTAGNPLTVNGTLTDDQNIQGSGLSGSTLTIGIENGTNETVDLSSLGNDWKLSGNAGTTVGTDFLGTTDNVSLSIKTNNAERLRITSSGNVGIGTTTPSSLLQVNGGTRIIHSTSPSLYIENNSNSNSNYALQIFSQGSARSWISSSGRGYFADRVGLGTTSPSEKLQIYGATENILVTNTSETDAGINFTDAQVPTTQYAGITYGCGDNDLNFINASATPRMVIESNGEVGIGTTSPSEALDVTGDIRATGIVYWGGSGIRTEDRTDAGASGSGIRSGFFQTSAPSPAANWPTGASGWWHLLDVRHNNATNNYAMQFAGSFYDQKIYFRKTNNSATQSWNEITTAATETYKATSLSSDATITTTSWTDVTGMTLTFTAKKSTVMIMLTSAGHGYTNSMAFISLRVWNITDGVSLGGTSNKMQAYDDQEGTVTVWNAGFTKVISGLTVGTTYQFKVQGKVEALFGVDDAVIYPVSLPDSEHMTLSVFY